MNKRRRFKAKRMRRVGGTRMHWTYRSSALVVNMDALMTAMLEPIVFGVREWNQQIRVS